MSEEDFPLYPLVELSTALLFVFAYMQIGWSLELVVAWTLISLIYNYLCFRYHLYAYSRQNPARVYGDFFCNTPYFPAKSVVGFTSWWSNWILPALFIAIISRGGMGGGDIKLFGVLGFLLGTKLVLMSFFFATLIGAVAGIIGLSTGIFKKGEPIPFGPFIGVGTLIVYFFHESILNWYLALLQF